MVRAGDGTGTWEDLGDVGHAAALARLAKAAATAPSAAAATAPSPKPASTTAEAGPPAPAATAAAAPATTRERLPGGIEEIEERTGGRLQRPAGTVTEVLQVRHVPRRATAGGGQVAAACSALPTSTGIWSIATATGDDHRPPTIWPKPRSWVPSSAERPTSGRDIAAIPGGRSGRHAREFLDPGALETERDGVRQVPVEDSLRLVELLVALDGGQVVPEGPPLRRRLGAGGALARHEAGDHDDDQANPDQRRDRDEDG